MCLWQRLNLSNRSLELNHSVCYLVCIQPKASTHVIRTYIRLSSLTRILQAFLTKACDKKCRTKETKEKESTHANDNMTLFIRRTRHPRHRSTTTTGKYCAPARYFFHVTVVPSTGIPLRARSPYFAFSFAKCILYNPKNS